MHFNTAHNYYISAFIIVFFNCPTKVIISTKFHHSCSFAEIIRVIFGQILKLCLFNNFTQLSTFVSIILFHCCLFILDHLLFVLFYLYCCHILKICMDKLELQNMLHKGFRLKLMYKFLKIKYNIANLQFNTTF